MEEVDAVLANSQDTVLVIVNSVCGCAAGGAMPGATMALKHAKRPAVVTTVFAGQDKEATDRARSYFHGYAPSSPSIALLKGGEVLHMVQRRDIEGRSPEQIAAGLVSAFDKYC